MPRRSRPGQIGTLIVGLGLGIACGPVPHRDAFDPRQPRADSETVSTSVSMHLRIDVPGETRKVRLLVAVPRTIEGRQRVRHLELEPMPVLRTERGTRMAEYVFAPPPRVIEIRIDAILELYAADLEAARGAARPVLTPESAPYLVDEPFIERDDPAVRAALERAIPERAAGADAIADVRAIYGHVRARLSYGGYAADDVGAAKTAIRGAGDCTDYVDLFVAIARARGIPARHVAGYVISGYGDGQTPKHSWAEIRLPRWGWVPVDPLWGDLGRASFERRPNAYIQMYANRNEPFTRFWRYWYWGDPVIVRETLTIDGRSYAADGMPIAAAAPSRTVF